MSRIVDAIKEKRRSKVEEEKARQEMLNILKEEAKFEYRIDRELSFINKLFSDDSVDAITVEINNKDIAQFLKAVYSKKMAEFVVHIDENVAYIERKLAI